jgi:hypothetical protein
MDENYRSTMRIDADDNRPPSEIEANRFVSSLGGEFTSVTIDSKPQPGVMNIDGTLRIQASSNTNLIEVVNQNDQVVFRLDNEGNLMFTGKLQLADKETQILIDQIVSRGQEELTALKLELKKALEELNYLKREREKQRQPVQRFEDLLTEE